MKGFLGFIGVISLLTGLYNLANGYFIYSQAETIMQQTLGVNSSIVGSINILIFVCSIGFILSTEK